MTEQLYELEEGNRAPEIALDRKRSDVFELLDTQRAHLVAEDQLVDYCAFAGGGMGTALLGLQGFGYARDALRAVGAGSLRIQQLIVRSVTSPGYIDPSEVEKLTKCCACMWRDQGQAAGLEVVDAIAAERIQLYWQPEEPMLAAAMALPVEHAEEPEASDWEAALGQIRTERAAYERNKEEILALYEGQYVAMLAGRVIDHDVDYASLAERVYARVADEPVLITQASRKRQVSKVSVGLACR
jgi:hypothetical protein